MATAIKAGGAGNGMMASTAASALSSSLEKGNGGGTGGIFQALLALEDTEQEEDDQEEEDDEAGANSRDIDDDSYLRIPMKQATIDDVHLEEDLKRFYYSRSFALSLKFRNRGLPKGITPSFMEDVFAGSYSELNTQHPQDHDTVRFNGIPNNQYPRNGNSYAMSNDNFEHNRGHLSNSWRSERPEGWRNEYDHPARNSMGRRPNFDGDHFERGFLNRDRSEPIPVVQRKPSSGQSWRVSPDEKSSRDRESGRWRSDPPGPIRGPRLSDGRSERSVHHPRSWESGSPDLHDTRRKVESGMLRDNSSEFHRENRRESFRDNREHRNRGDPDSRENWRELNRDQQSAVMKNSVEEKPDKLAWTNEKAILPSKDPVPLKSSHEKGRLDVQKVQERSNDTNRDDLTSTTLPKDDGNSKRYRATEEREQKVESKETFSVDKFFETEATALKVPTDATHEKRSSRFANLFERNSMKETDQTFNRFQAKVVDTPSENGDVTNSQASKNLLHLLQNPNQTGFNGGNSTKFPSPYYAEPSGTSASDIEKAMMANAMTSTRLSDGSGDQNIQNSAQHNNAASHQLMAMLNLSEKNAIGGQFQFGDKLHQSSEHVSNMQAPTHHPDPRFHMEMPIQNQGFTSRQPAVHDNQHMRQQMGQEIGQQMYPGMYMHHPHGYPQMHPPVQPSNMMPPPHMANNSQVHQAGGLPAQYHQAYGAPAYRP